MASAEELRIALRAAEEAEVKESKDALEAINISYSYEIQWRSEHSFRVDRRIDAKTVKAFEDWKAKYPGSKARRYDIAMDKLHSTDGANYLLIGNYLAMVGGGLVVFKKSDDKDPWSYEPALLTDIEAGQLRDCVVPYSILYSPKIRTT